MKYYFMSKKGGGVEPVKTAKSASTRENLVRLEEEV
ncbi:MAG: hypothetical protein K0Q81_423 [Paenibacillus sp.]|nr:hypothetical protein [Paenibacillus sp.]